jgi:hypothetical protein
MVGYGEAMDVAEEKKMGKEHVGSMPLCYHANITSSKKKAPLVALINQSQNLNFQS